MSGVRSAKLQFLLLMALFGCLGPVIREIALPAAATACLRAWISAAALAVWLLLPGNRPRGWSFREVVLPMAASGLFIALDWIGLFAAYEHTTIATATVCYYTVPILVLIASPLALGERFTTRHAVCSAIAFLGMAFVSGAVENGLPALAEIRGIAFALFGAVAYAAVILINKRWPAGDPVFRTAIQLLVAAVLTTPYILAESASLHFEAKNILLLALLGVVFTAFAYVAYFALITRIPARSVAILSYADPPVAVFLSVFLLAEPITLHGAIGSVLILGGALASEFDGSRGKGKDQ